MGSYIFRWPYNANEVFVTGTFDDWGKTVKLDRKGDAFEKEVHFPVTDEKVHYKFVVDNEWTTDSRVPEEKDGANNINNVLYPHQIKKDTIAALGSGPVGMATISSVAPDSTTAALAAAVPKESSKSEANGVHPVTISSVAPGSTTAELGKEVPLEQRTSIPGEYSVKPIPASNGIGNPIHLKPGEPVPEPSTFNSNTIQSTVREDGPGETSVPGEYSVKPIPASDGIGNPIHLKPGEPVPDPSTFNSNTIQSTVREDVPEETSAPGEFSVKPIPASDGIGNPIHLKPGEPVPDPSTFNPNTIQSTVRTDKGGYEQNASAPLTGAQDSAFNVPPVSRNMIPESSLPMGESAATVANPGATIQSAAPTSTTAALAASVPLESQKGTTSEPTAPDVPEVVRRSISEAHVDPEAAANEHVVEEKKEVEEELHKKVPVDNSVGAPAPATTAATSETAPKATGEPDSAQLSPRTVSPPGAGDKTTPTTQAATAGTASQVPPTASKTGKETKKKKRSSFFSRLKEKFR